MNTRDDSSTRAGSAVDRSRVSSVAEQMHSSYLRASLLRQAEDKKARKVRFYRNGDRFYRGAIYAVSPERFRTFDSLLAELTKSPICDPKLMPNGVRYIFSLDGSRKILSLDELQEGDSYVCSTLDLFKDIDYSKSLDPAAWHQSGRGTRLGVAGVQPLTELPPLPGTATKHLTPPPGSSAGGDVPGVSAAVAMDEAAFVEQIRPRLVTVVRAGARPRMAVRIPLNKRTARSFEQVLRGVSDIVRLDSGAVKRIYTLSGKQVICLADFFLEDTVFLACGTERPNSDDFQLDSNEVRLVCAYRFSTSARSERVTLRSQSSSRPHPERVAGASFTSSYRPQSRSQPASPLTSRRYTKTAAADGRSRPADRTVSPNPKFFTLEQEEKEDQAKLRYAADKQKATDSSSTKSATPAAGEQLTRTSSALSADQYNEDDMHSRKAQSSGLNFSDLESDYSNKSSESREMLSSEGEKELPVASPDSTFKVSATPIDNGTANNKAPEEYISVVPDSARPVNAGEALRDEESQHPQPSKHHLANGHVHGGGYRDENIISHTLAGHLPNGHGPHGPPKEEAGGQLHGVRSGEFLDDSAATRKHEEACLSNELHQHTYRTEEHITPASEQQQQLTYTDKLQQPTAPSNEQQQTLTDASKSREEVGPSSAKQQPEGSKEAEVNTQPIDEQQQLVGLDMTEEKATASGEQQHADVDKPEAQRASSNEPLRQHRQQADTHKADEEVQPASKQHEQLVDSEETTDEETTSYDKKRQHVDADKPEQQQHVDSHETEELTILSTGQKLMDDAEPAELIVPSSEPPQHQAEAQGAEDQVQPAREQQQVVNVDETRDQTLSSSEGQKLMDVQEVKAKPEEQQRAANSSSGTQRSASRSSIEPADDRALVESEAALATKQQPAGGNSPVDPQDFSIDSAMVDTDGEDEMISQRYAVLRTIAKDGAITVKECINKESGRLFALKIIDKQLCQPADLQAVAKEVSFLTEISHENLIGMVEKFETSRRWYLVMDLDEGMDFLSLVMSMPSYSEADAGCLFVDLLTALRYLHSHGIVHGDICLDNLMVTRGSTATSDALPAAGTAKLKLGAFAKATYVDNEERSVRSGSTGIQDVAIEAAMEESHVSKETASDLKAAGLILWTLLTGKTNPPPDRVELINWFSALERPGITKEAVDFLATILNMDGSLKMNSVDQALNHPWFEILTSTAHKRNISEPSFVDRKDIVLRNLSTDFKWKPKYSSKATAISILMKSSLGDVVNNHGELNRAFFDDISADGDGVMQRKKDVQSLTTLQGNEELQEVSNDVPVGEHGIPDSATTNSLDRPEPGNVDATVAVKSEKSLAGNTLGYAAVGEHSAHTLASTPKAGQDVPSANEKEKFASAAVDYDNDEFY